MFGINGIEFFMVVAFALLLFGPDKLPGIAKTIGRFMGEFKRTQEVMESQIRAEMYRTNMGETAEKTTPPADYRAADEEPDEEAEEGSGEPGEDTVTGAAKAVTPDLGSSEGADDTEEWDEEEDEEGA